MHFPESLGLAVILERHAPTDAFVSNTCANFDALPQGARLGTSACVVVCRPRQHARTWKY